MLYKEKQNDRIEYRNFVICTEDLQSWKDTFKLHYTNIPEEKQIQYGTQFSVPGLATINFYPSTNLLMVQPIKENPEQNLLKVLRDIPTIKGKRAAASN